MTESFVSQSWEKSLSRLPSEPSDSFEENHCAGSCTSRALALLLIRGGLVTREVGAARLINNVPLLLTASRERHS